MSRRLPHAAGTKSYHAYVPAICMHSASDEANRNLQSPGLLQLRFAAQPAFRREAFSEAEAAAPGCSGSR